MTAIHTSNQALFTLGLGQQIQCEVRRVEASALQALLDSVNHPPDLPHLQSVTRGALRSFEAALRLIECPNHKALELKGQLSSLCEATNSAYEKYVVADVASSHHRRLVEFQGWKALAEAAAVSAFEMDSLAHAALGVNLGLALLQRKDMANAFCRNVRKDFQNCDLEVEALLRRPAGDPICPWHAQFYKFWGEFLVEFSMAPVPPVAELDIHQATKSSLIGRAAYPSARRRAAVLDSTCLSRDQVQVALSQDGRGVFNSANEYQFALWLTGISGAPIESAHRIPVWFGGQPTDQYDDWTIYIDAESMLLKRDYSRLAKGAASATKLSSDEASFIYSTSVPDRFIPVLRHKAGINGSCTLGDIVPGLKLLRSEGSLYPSLSEFKPTWARWARTLGTLSIQEGDDTFMAASLFGDFGLCAKSKIYYASVSSSEAFRYQSSVYLRFDWGEISKTTGKSLNFGSRVVPMQSELLAADEQIARRVNELRPARRRSLEAVITFHNYVAAAFGFRWMLRLSLRSAGTLPLAADIYPEDITVDLVEKSSKGRIGGMAALLTKNFHSELLAYRAHIATLTKLTSVGEDLPELKSWGQEVLDRQPVDLVRTIQTDGTLLNLSSVQTLRALALDDRFAPDFGRKWTENAARIAAFSTSEIDRLLRHEVKGQESTASVSEGSELNWSRNVSTRLDLLHAQVLRGSIQGLRASA